MSVGNEEEGEGNMSLSVGIVMDVELLLKL